ncbi:MAG TPA: hypothetical protein VII11_05805 [Bacteroidota bacterium]
MAIKRTASSQSLTEALDRFMQEEKVVMDSLQGRIANVTDADLQSVFNKFSEIRARYLAELESQFGELKSRAEITKQINDMFL